MSSVKGFVAGVVVASALAGAGWVLRVRPVLEEADRRVAAAEESARRTGRQASDAQLWAESERDRNRIVDERVKELERLLVSTRPGDKEPKDPKGPHEPPVPETPPEDWERSRLNQEIENLARAPQMVLKHQRYPLVVKALVAHPDESADLLSQMLRAGLEPPLVTTAANLAIGVGDARVVPALLDRWKVETDPVAQRALVRALAALPGDEAVPILLVLWADPSSERGLRTLAIHGLALRGHDTARRTADGREPSTPPQRVRAIESLRTFAEQGKWADATLVPVFGRALRTADGPAQRKLSLIALEGLWSKDCLADVDAFAADAATAPDLAVRARKLSEALRSGAARPEGAGAVERGLTADTDE
jgi:hypothetical protein